MSPSSPTDQRARILDIALRLLSDRGVAATSMRDLANACELNVSTLYHYFPSKADLVQAVIAQRRYVERINEEQPPRGDGRPPADRLAGLIRFLWTAALAEEPVWRLMVAESIHGDRDVRTTIAGVVEALDAGIAAWIDEVVPELAERGKGTVETVARLVHATLFSLMVEHLALGDVDADRAADDLAAVVFSES